MVDAERDQIVLDKLDEIINEGEIINDQAKKYGNPKDYLEMTKIVFAFIKRKGLILYGGEAIDKNLKKKGLDGIYGPDSKPDYDFYSYDYERDSIELCNILFKKGYKFVRRIPRKHRGTFGIQANTATIADITYIPKNIFLKIPKVKIRGVWYISSNFIVKNLYLGLVRPRSSENYARWEKDWIRLQLMNKAFPLKYPAKFSPNWRKVGYSDTVYAKDKLYQEALKLIALKFIKGNPQIIVSGERAVHYYLDTKPDNVYYELVSVDKMSTIHTQMIQKLLTKHFGQDVTIGIDVFAPFVSDLPSRIRIKINDFPLVDIYSVEHECVAVSPNKTQVHYVNYYYLMHFLYAQFFYNTVYPDLEQLKAPIVVDRIIQLRKTREKFLHQNKLTGFESQSGKWRVFGQECIGIQKSDPEITRELTLEGIKQYPRYYPDFEFIDLKDYTPAIVPPNYDGSEVLSEKK